MDLNKKELKREYLENPCMAGIYLIQNTCTHQYMLGSAKNVEGAMNRHIFELRHKLHRNQSLQQDWNELSEEQFSIKILEYVKKDEQNISRTLKTLLEKWAATMDNNHQRIY